MKIEQKIWNEESGWTLSSKSSLEHFAQLVLVFGSSPAIKRPGLFDEIRGYYPNAYLFGCSTAGEICGIRVFDGCVVATAIYLENTQIFGAQVKWSTMNNSFEAGQRLAQAFSWKGLTHLLLLSDGLKINGSELVKGLIETLPPNVSLTGGLAGDGQAFSETFVLANCPPQTDTIAAVGFYGEHLKIGCGSWGGWDPFGPERLVTKSKGNVLYEMDGRSALSLYKLYLGEHAQGLPATGMYFPLNLRDKESKMPVVRAILSVNEAEESVIFAGDIPEGTYVRLMKANVDRLIEGAVTAAELSNRQSYPPQFALLISCTARKEILKQRTEEEIEAVQDIFGHGTVLSGFYSYGEICPHIVGAKPEFHNQTMTITTFSEE